MKIGILTFHWATNYGAVLQAFALQSFLKKNGHDVYIINFAPYTFRDSFFKCFISKNPQTIIDNLKNYWKEINIAKFRKKHLTLTKRYYTPEQLIKNPPQMDAYIAGSDQIWNQYVSKTLKNIYFLPFGNEKTLKISYAASFGLENFPDSLSAEITPLLKKFSSISVREKSGLEILKKTETNNGILLPDPTLLLSQHDYLNILDGINNNPKADYFFYVLQKKQNTIDKIYSYLKNSKQHEIVHSQDFKQSVVGVECWFKFIINSNFVITNSFHGVVFSIIFNKPFIAVLIEGKLS